MKLKQKKTARGFDLIEFTDDYNNRCTLQKSSSVVAHIWLGIPNPIIKEFWTDGIPSSKASFLTSKWEDRDISSLKQSPTNDILIDSRMHLTRKQVKRLLPYLQKFVETGDIV